MNYRSLETIQAALIDGTVTMPQLVQSYLDNIKKSAELNIYVEVWEEEAMQRARDLQAKYESSPESIGRLYGAVISIKDVLCYKGHQVTAASGILAGFESQYTATAVQRALDADAILIGRTNCDEFAMGSTNEHSTYGVTRNADDKDHVPGGSSGGAAVSVQAGTCLIGLGSDTGGSVRQPAAYCGLYGFKPTYGRISRYGLIAYGSSFDQIGIITHTIRDIQTTLEVIGGRDKMDATSSERPITEVARHSLKKRKIAYLNEVMDHPGLSNTIKMGTEAKIEALRGQGHEVAGVSFDLIDYLVPTYYVLTTAEASSNLGRYDGVRYGHRTKDISDINSLYVNSRSEGFGMEVKRRIMMGTFVLSVGYYDAYFTKAQQVRQLISDRMKSILSEYDCILMPTTTGTAPRIGDATKDPVEMYLSDVFTVLANLCGLPAISVPLDIDGCKLSAGVQLMSAAYDEATLMELAQEL